VDHEEGHFLWRCEALDQRGRADVVKELRLDLLEALVAQARYASTKSPTPRDTANWAVFAMP